MPEREERNDSEHFGSCNCGEGMREVLSVTFVGDDVILILVQEIILVDVSEVCDECLF